jgi:hypothetical protein
VNLYGFSSRWDEDPIRLFKTREEAEEALRRIGDEDTLGLAADAFVVAIEFNPTAPAQPRV